MSQAALHLVGKPPAPEKVVCGPKKRKQAVLEFIGSARTSLLVSVFRCDDLDVLCALGQAVRRGVRVEALLTGRARGWGQRLGPLAGCLESMGIAVHRFTGPMKYHAKFLVADGEAALVATFNLTRKCFRRTRDFLMVSSDPALASGLAAMFRADVEGAAIAPGALGERVILGPDAARERIEALLGGARHSIRILDHKLSDPSVLAILRDRRRNGVAVEIERGELDGGLTPHGRLIVVDQRIAVFGSFALSAKSLDARRELAVVIDAPELVAKLERQFEKASKAAGRLAETAA